MAKKKAAKRKKVVNGVKRYAVNHGIVLPHGYEIRKKAPSKRKKK
jgi:hypothetical protein